MALAVVALAVPGCGPTAECSFPQDGLRMHGVGAGSVIDVASVCVDTLCFRAPFNGTREPGHPSASWVYGELDLWLDRNTLPDRATTVTLTLTDGRVLRGAAPRPVSETRNDPPCIRPHRDAEVTLS